MFKDSFVSDKIVELRKNIAALQQWVMSNRSITESEYKSRRCETVNRPAIEALTGMEIREKDSKLKPGRVHKAPTSAQLTEIAVAVDELVNGIERQVRILFENAKNPNSDDDDTGIPSEFRFVGDQINVNLDSKAKDLKEALLGQNGDSISRAYFTGVDCMKINQIGEKIRKDKTIKTTLVIGGIVLAIAAGVMVAIYIWHRKKKAEAERSSLDEERERMDSILTSQMEDNPTLSSLEEQTNADIPHVIM